MDDAEFWEDTQSDEDLEVTNGEEEDFGADDSPTISKVICFISHGCWGNQFLFSPAKQKRDICIAFPASSSAAA